MRTKTEILILMFLFLTFFVSAQSTFNHEDFKDFLTEKFKPNDIFNLPVKSANEDIFVLDSSIQITQKQNRNDTIWEYFKYDDLGNLVEVINLTTFRDASAPHNFRNQYTYDENGNVILKIYYDLDFESKLWVAVSKHESNFNENGNLLESIFFRYDTLNKKWLHHLKIVKSYDVSGNEIGEAYYVLNDSQEWITERMMEKNYYEGDSSRLVIIEYEWSEDLGNVTKQKYETTYDKQGRFLSMVWSEWDESQSKLEYVRKREQEYLENGNKAIILIYNFDKNSGIWIEDERTEIVLENGKYVEYTESKWNKELNQWIYTVKFETNYNSDWNEIGSNAFRWNLDENDWEKIQKTEKTYYANGLVESSYGYNLDTAGQWIGSSKYEFTYNESGEETSTIESFWDYEKNDWKYKYKVEKEYDLNQQVVTDLSYNWDNAREEWIIKRKKTFEYDIYGNNTKVSDSVFLNEIWELDRTEEYFYSKLITDANIISQIKNIKLYPNPANEIFTIETQNPEIAFGKLYNLNGKLMKNLTIQKGVNTFDISDLKSGIYLIQIPQKVGSVTKKLIKN